MQGRRLPQKRGSFKAGFDPFSEHLPGDAEDSGLFRQQSRHASEAGDAVGPNNWRFSFNGQGPAEPATSSALPPLQKRDSLFADAATLSEGTGALSPLLQKRPSESTSGVHTSSASPPSAFLQQRHSKSMSGAVSSGEAYTGALGKRPSAASSAATAHRCVTIALPALQHSTVPSTSKNNAGGPLRCAVRRSKSGILHGPTCKGTPTKVHFPTLHSPPSATIRGEKSVTKPAARASETGLLKTRKSCPGYLGSSYLSD